MRRTSRAWRRSRRLSKYGGDAALTTLRSALADREWPVRVRAAELLRGLGETDAEPVRPAIVRQPPEFFSSPAILRPRYLPHAFIDTAAARSKWN